MLYMYQKTSLRSLRSSIPIISCIILMNRYLVTSSIYTWLNYSGSAIRDSEDAAMQDTCNKINMLKLFPVYQF